MTNLSGSHPGAPHPEPWELTPLRIGPANPVNEVVGVRIPSYASVYFTYHFGQP